MEAKPIIPHVSLFTFKPRVFYIPLTVSTLLFKQPVRNIHNLISDLIFLLIQDDVSTYRSSICYKLTGRWQLKPYPCYISFLQNVPNKQCIVHFEKFKTITHLVNKFPFFIEPASQYCRKKCFTFNPLKPELISICYLLALLGAHYFLHVSRIRVKLLTFRLLMSYIYMQHPFLMFLDHTQRRSTVGRTPLDE